MSENIKYIETRYGKIPLCSKCGSDVHWQECGNCEDGYSHHDCGEDTCCCRDPRPNVKCDICNGEGGWWVCLSCKPSIDSDSERKTRMTKCEICGHETDLVECTGCRKAVCKDCVEDCEICGNHYCDDCNHTVGRSGLSKFEGVLDLCPPCYKHERYIHNEIEKEMTIKSDSGRKTR